MLAQRPAVRMRLSNPPSNGYSAGVRPNVPLNCYEPMVASACFAAARICELFASLFEPTIALGLGETNIVARTTQMPRHIYSIAQN